METTEQKFKVCPTSDVEPGEGYSYKVNDRVIGVFNVEGSFYAIDDACPHMGVSLSTGHLDGCVVTCPLHAWRFNVTDGTWVDNPRVSTDAWPVTIEDGFVFVTMPAKPASEQAKADETSGEVTDE